MRARVFIVVLNESFIRVSRGEKKTMVRQLNVGTSEIWPEFVIQIRIKMMLPFEQNEEIT